MEVSLPVKAGTRLVTTAYVSAMDSSLPWDGRPNDLPITSFEFKQSAIDNLQISGPYSGQVPENTATRAPTPVITAAPTAQAYTVQKGDTLGLIAKKTGARQQDIVNANRLADPSRITVGQTLFIPGGK